MQKRGRRMMVDSHKASVGSYLSSEVGYLILHLTNFVGLVHRIGKISFHDHFLVLSEKN